MKNQLTFLFIIGLALPLVFTYDRYGRNLGSNIYRKRCYNLGFRKRCPALNRGAKIMKKPISCPPCEQKKGRYINLNNVKVHNYCKSKVCEKEKTFESEFTLCSNDKSKIQREKERIANELEYFKIRQEKYVKEVIAETRKEELEKCFENSKLFKLLEEKFIEISKFCPKEPVDGGSTSDINKTSVNLETASQPDNFRTNGPKFPKKTDPVNNFNKNVQIHHDYEEVHNDTVVDEDCYDEDVTGEPPRIEEPPLDLSVTEIDSYSPTQSSDEIPKEIHPSIDGEYYYDYDNPDDYDKPKKR